MAICISRRRGYWVKSAGERQTTRYETRRAGNDALVDDSAFDRVLAVAIQFVLEQETRNHSRPAQGLNQRFVSCCDELPNEVPKLGLLGKRHGVVGQGGSGVALLAPGGPEVGVLQ